MSGLDLSIATARMNVADALLERALASLREILGNDIEPVCLLAKESDGEITPRLDTIDPEALLWLAEDLALVQEITAYLGVGPVADPNWLDELIEQGLPS